MSNYGKSPTVSFQFTHATYRKRIFSDGIARRARSLIRGICEKHQVKILKGHTEEPDHIHLVVSIPPDRAVSRLTRQLKGRTAHAVTNEFPLLRRQYRGRHCGRAAISAVATAL